MGVVERFSKHSHAVNPFETKPKIKAFF